MKTPRLVATTVVAFALLVLPTAPASATFSLCAIDPATGESGVAVTTRVPYVGRAVPWARAGVGAVATQAWTIVQYGEQGLDLLEEGMAPAEVIEKLLADDKMAQSRQLGVIDMQGRSAAHTGTENNDWAGSRQGPNYTVQGNILVGQEVIDAVADCFESTADSGMPLAERMLLAMAAGQKEGGDRRWGNLQSAAIRIADPNNPGRGGDHISLAIDVGEHPHPIEEMKRIYETTMRRLGYRSFSAISGPDVIELKRMLHTLGHWRPDLEAFPEAPRYDVPRSLSRTDPEAFQQRRRDYSAKAREYNQAYAQYDEETVAAVDAYRKAKGLSYPGTPRGLVDDALAHALREDVAASLAVAEQ